VIAAIVYILCALTSLICAVLLWRGYARSRARLLMWSGFCFFGLSLNNALLLVDTTMAPATDLAMTRLIPALAGISLLIYGLVWDTR
jgi:hypothetical protein